MELYLLLWLWLWLFWRNYDSCKPIAPSSGVSCACPDGVERQFFSIFWEMAQVPFFSGMAEARHWDVVWLCTRATVGDANIAFGAYVLRALFVKTGSGLQSRGVCRLYRYTLASA